MLDGFSEVDGAVHGIICDSFEYFMVEASLGVVEDKFLIEGDGGEELFFEFEISWFWEHGVGGRFI